MEAKRLAEYGYSATADTKAGAPPEHAQAGEEHR